MCNFVSRCGIAHTGLPHGITDNKNITRMKNLRLLTPLMIILAVIAVGCKSKGGKRKPPQENSSTAGTVVMACDASFENIMEQEIQVFEFCYPHASILPYYIDNHAAIDSLMHGKARVAVTATPLSREQEKILRGRKHFAKQKRIAVDAVAVIVNPDNDIENMSVKDLAEILTGEITRWDQLAPSKLGDIQVVFDHNGSSVVTYAVDSVMQGKPFAKNVYTAGSMKAVFDAVRQRKDAIGLVGVSWISTDMRTADLTVEEKTKTLERDDSTATDFVTDVKVMPMRHNNSRVAVKPYQAYIFDGTYPLYRSIWMINTGASGSLANGFFAFVTSFQGQKLIQTTGVLPGTVYRRMVEVN